MLQACGSIQVRICWMGVRVCGCEGKRAGNGGGGGGGWKGKPGPNETEQNGNRRCAMEEGQGRGEVWGGCRNSGVMHHAFRAEVEVMKKIYRGVGT